MSPVASLLNDIDDARQARDPQRLLAALPYAGFLGVEAALVDGQPRLTLPFQDKLIGNSSAPALHGGALTGFAELTAIVTLLWRQESVNLPKSVTTTVDFRRSAGTRDVSADAKVTRLGRRIATVEVTLWQDSPDKATASAETHFLLG